MNAEQTIARLQLDIRHLTRRLEQRPISSSRALMTSKIMNAKEAMVRAQMERDKAIKENGELRARLALLEDVIGRACA